MSRMYENVKTWNPFVGCRFKCVYCERSFQRQAKRRRKWCELCYRYEPHFHPERLNRIPKADTIFACAYGDIAFCSAQDLLTIIDIITMKHDRTFYLQTKSGRIAEFLSQIKPDNLYIGITLETNRSTFITQSKYKSYSQISLAPTPPKRAKMVHWLDATIDYVAIEPILDFDLEEFVKMIYSLDPEFVYIGYDNHNCRLPEPPLVKTLDLIEELERFTVVREKTIRKAWWEADSQ